MLEVLGGGSSMQGPGHPPSRPDHRDRTPVVVVVVVVWQPADLYQRCFRCLWHTVRTTRAHASGEKG